MGPRNPSSASARTLDGTPAYHGDALYAARLEWTDEALMIAINARDELAFAVLYDRYVDLVYSSTSRVVLDSQLAEDITQDVFVRLWQRPEQFIAERGRFLSWLMSVARNRAVDELRARGRRRRREVASSPAEDPLKACSDADDPLLSAELHEAQVQVRRALGDLPPEQRLALELAYFSGMTQQEIAAALHEPLGTIKTRVRLGMQKLRRALEDRV